METRRAEEMGRRQSYLKFLEQQMREKQEMQNYERQEKDRMRSQIKSRADQVRSQENEVRMMKQR